MSLRTTIILLLFVCGLGAGIWFWERHQATSLDNEVGSSLTSMAAVEIESFEIKNAAGRVKFKKKADGAWFITEPFDDRADPEFIKAILGLAEKAEVAEVVTRDRLNNSGRKPYGLDDASAIQMAYRKGGKTISRLNLGKAGTLGETVYAETPGNDRQRAIYLIWAKSGTSSTHVRDQIVKSADEMRDPWLLPFRSDHVVKLSMRRGAGEIEIIRQSRGEKENPVWILTKPLKTKGNQTQIDEFVGLFSSAKAASLLPVNTQPPNTDQPDAELTFWDKPQGKGSTIRLFADKDPASKTAIGYLTDRKAWFKIESNYLSEDVIPKSPNGLRSQALGDLAPEQVSTLIIDAPNERTALYKVQRLWLIKTGDTTFLKASSERVMRMMEKINQAEIGEFVTDSLTDPVQYGLDKPYLTVAFASGVNKSLTELVTPNEQNSITLRLGVGPDKKLYANFLGQPSVYQMLPEHFSLIPTQSVKYRDLQLLEFQPMQVRRVRQSLGVEPPVEITAPPNSFDWTAARAGGDVTPLLNKEHALRLVSRLATLQAADWTVGLKEGHDAMQNQTLQIDLDVEYQENPSSDVKTKSIVLNFAPAGDEKTALYFHGRCTDIDSYFLIRRDDYKELAAPLLNSPGSP